MNWQDILIEQDLDTMVFRSALAAAFEIPPGWHQHRGFN